MCVPSCIGLIIFTVILFSFRVLPAFVVEAGKVALRKKKKRRKKYIPTEILTFAFLPSLCC